MSVSTVNSAHDRQAYIDKIIEDPNLKFIFVGGKGGVGKTTTSSAIAIQLAYNRKVLLLSTDPAHSLGDAFRTRFGGEPTPVPGIPNLDVLEINPHTYLAHELQQWGELAHQAGYNDLIDNVEKLQDWISGIPGIDEATALSSVVDLLEGGHYDIIVFDTAPTGHTLKLLQLPDILQVGLTKLESWQTSLWQYWQMVKGGNYTQTEALRKKVTARIRDYKKGIEKVGRMLKDRMRTTFVVVCIAEYLSIKESQRLLRELHKDQVAVSHVVVNQLVMGDFTSLSIEDAATNKKGEEVLGQAQWGTVQQAVQFCRARNAIQQKYLNEFRAFPEVADVDLSVVQLPLLP
uniref:ArsA/GET3 Anion-transporting ATPase-like domain-containing protein n=1 Tax=Oxyrrhis marina TaxID=2969 RepID=A0A7S3XEW3_OXYMA